MCGNGRASTWWYAFAAIHSLPSEVLEAAELDNCGWGGKLRYVIVPLLRPTLLNLYILAFIGKMKVFDLVWIMTQGGPLWSTETVSTYVYKRAFNWNTFDLGYPSAIASVSGSLVVVGLVLVLNRALRTRDRIEFLSMVRSSKAYRLLTSGGMMAILVAYTVYSTAPFLWVATMSVRTTTEISTDHYAWPNPFHWEQFREAWIDSNFNVYFMNSLMVTLVTSVVVLTLAGAAAAHCLARYRFRGNRLIYAILFSSIIFPPQVVLISIYQVLVDYGLYNSRVGLVLVYISLQLPLTVYLLEGFLRPHPAGSLRRGEGGRLRRFRDLRAPGAAGRAAGDRDHHHPELYPAVERVPVRGGADHR